MNFRKNSILIVGGSIAALFLVVAIYFLVSQRGHYKHNRSELNAAQNRLTSLNNRNPYPSAENVRLAGNNLELLKARHEALQESLMREQIQPELIEPARFAPMLEQTTLRIRAQAAASGVTLPAEPGLGFKDYAAGKLPPNDPKVMERLVIQIRALEDLFNLVMESKVNALESIVRDDFEIRTDATPEVVPEGRGRGRGAVPARGPAAAVARPVVAGLPLSPLHDQYTTERFGITVVGRESAIWDLLNRLMSRRIHYTLVDVALENTRTDLGRPVDMKAKLTALSAAARQTAPAGAAAVAAPEIRMEDISRDERVVGGRDLIRARLVIDMIRFVPDGEQEAQP